MAGLAKRLRTDLAQALRDRDMARAKVLRTTLAAIGNAEAVEGVSSVEGVVGYGDVTRRELGDEDVAGVIGREIDEWETAHAEYVRIGHVERAEVLRQELEVLRGYVGPG